MFRDEFSWPKWNNDFATFFCEKQPRYRWYKDDEWELIEEKQEPKQGDDVKVQTDLWNWQTMEFVCFYQDKVIAKWIGKSFHMYESWKFNKKKIDITLQEIAYWKWVEKELINIINE